MNTTAVIFAIIVRVIDGDTFMVNLPCDIDVICKHIPVRLAHIDTPEIKGKCDSEKQLAQQAKTIAEGMLKTGETLVIANAKRDNYFRLLVEVPKLEWALLEAGVARRYEGKKKVGWCGK